jgi:hypothetical protein
MINRMRCNGMAVDRRAFCLQSSLDRDSKNSGLFRASCSVPAPFYLRLLQRGSQAATHLSHRVKRSADVCALLVRSAIDVYRLWAIRKCGRERNAQPGKRRRMVCGNG